jgi:hypothetical protein
VAAEAVTPIGEVEAQPVLDEAGQPTAFPATPGVYAVFSPDGALQYIGLSRKARAGHRSETTLPKAG